MKRILLVVAMILLVNFGIVNAITPQEISEVKNLIESKTPCSDLSDPQLEIIGEYYMEQMHPGESHELMHKMMGLEEGSEAEEQFHINLTKTIYCNERGGFGMMSGGMMGPWVMNMISGGVAGNYPFGYGYGNYAFFWIIAGLLAISIALNIYLAFKIGRGKR